MSKKRPCRGCGKEKDASGARSHWCSECKENPLNRILIINSMCKVHDVHKTGFLIQSHKSSEKFKCKMCEKERRKRMSEDPVQRENFKNSQRKYRLYIKYGITEDQWDEIYTLQNGICPICKKNLRFRRDLVGKMPAVDHDHRTGVIRGLVCQYPCNYVLGYLHDNSDMFLSCSKYLNSPPTKGKINFVVPETSIAKKYRQK